MNKTKKGTCSFWEDFEMIRRLKKIRKCSRKGLYVVTFLLHSSVDNAIYYISNKQYFCKSHWKENFKLVIVFGYVKFLRNCELVE